MIKQRAKPGVNTVTVEEQAEERRSSTCHQQ
jgi:hypothetical protein